MIMQQNNLIPIIGLAILNGLFSPFLAIVFALQGLWYPFFLPASLPIVFAISSLLVSTVTLMIGGVPAAIYERVTGRKSDFISGLIWLIGVAVLTFPATGNIMKALGMAS
jgi:hypothetical protein